MILAAAKNCHRLLRAQVATHKGHSRARAFRGVFVARCDLRGLVRRNPYSTVQLCAIVRSVAAACRVYCAFKEAHHRTARRRRSECASRVRAMLYGRPRVNDRVNKYLLPTWSWAVGGSTGTFFGTLQKWIDLDELSQMAPVP